MKCNNTITLDKAQIDTNYYIQYIDGFKEEQLHRLYDLGLVKGTKIRPVLKSMFEGAAAYSVKDSVLALRNEDAKNITVSFRR